MIPPLIYLFVMIPPLLEKIKMLHQINDGATLLFIQSCVFGSFARCDQNKTVIFLMLWSYQHV